MKISSRDRILILAPHPDDESLAAGGLIQRAVAAGAKVRVIFATDGDNNPWPQRFVEKKIQIGLSDRARWGRRRRKEAIAALELLGLPKNSVRFLGLPDQGITDLLLRADEGILFQLWAELTEWSPTIFVIPSATDSHPDHSALFVLVHLALERLEQEARPPKLYRFIIHHPRRESERGRRTLRLSPREIARKREAILAHGSQMALSRTRFVGYAKEQEIFFAGSLAEQVEARHPIVSASLERGALKVQLRLRRTGVKLGQTNLLIAIESLTEGSLRWKVSLPSVSKCVPVQDLLSGALLRLAAVRIKGRRAEVSIPISARQPLKQVFLKFQQRLFLYDEAGWRQVPVPREQEAVTVAEPAAVRAH